MSDGVIPAEIRDGPAAIRATVRDARERANEAAGLLRARGARRVFVIGNGTSYHSALAATALYGRHAGPDDPIAVPFTAGEFRTYRPRLGPTDAVIGVSASGEFADVVAAFEQLAGSIPTVAIVHVPGSRLTAIADCVVLSSGGPSHVPVMTKTFSATLAATEMTLLALLGQGPLRSLAAALEAAAGHAEHAIASGDRQANRLLDTLGRYDHVFVVGAGIAHVAALEAALKLKEIANVHAEGGETWEVTSGAATIIGEGCAVIAIAPNGAGRAATAELIGHAASWGAATIEVGPEAVVPQSILIELPEEATEDDAALTTVPPIAATAFALAVRNGLDPDRPTWVARYHSQGLRHIVGVEGSR